MTQAKNVGAVERERERERERELLFMWLGQIVKYSKT